jgi:hypothetical protein
MIGGALPGEGTFLVPPPPPVEAFGATTPVNISQITVDCPEIQKFARMIISPIQKTAFAFPVILLAPVPHYCLSR